MRLQTKEQRAAMRRVFIPKNSAKDARSNELGEVYSYETLGVLYAIAFRGTAAKPEWHYRFGNSERRDQRIAEFFSSIEAHKQRVTQRRDEAKSYRHDVKVGDIFRSSWGYDQTNIDYYQVVELIGQHFAMVREIGAQSNETGWQQGDCVPAPGQWATEADYSEEGKRHHAEHGFYPTKAKPAFKVKIQSGYQGEPRFRVASYASASRMKPIAEVAGVKMYGASHWTAYA